MDERKLGVIADFLVTSVFIFFLIVSLIILFTGIAWEFLSLETSQFYILIMTSFTMVVAGVVLTNSFIYYTQLRNVRRLVILMLAGNVILLSLLYALTHPVNVQWSSLFADRIRNRTITTTFGFAAIPGALLCSFAKDSPEPLKTQVLYGIWGGLVIPIFALICFFSPQPLFILTSLEGGLGGLTIAGWLVAILVPLAGLIALLRFILEYKRRRDRVALAFAFALFLWILSSLFMSLLWDPQQIAEIMYMVNAMAGLIVIGFAMITDAIFQPFKTLEGMVHKRTEELVRSQQESELFLLAWSHKVGNILQGIMTFLDLYSKDDYGNPQLLKQQSEATELSWQGGVINRQVSWLTEVKMTKAQQLVAVDLNDAVVNAINSINELNDQLSIKFIWKGSSINVLADYSLDLLFTGLFSHFLMSHRDIESKIIMSEKEEPNFIGLEISSDSDMFFTGIPEFLRSRDLPDLVKMDLDLYLTRLLIERYNASVEWLDERKSAILLKFQRAS